MTETVRFSFGRNWQAFLDRLDEARVRAAEAYLRFAVGRDLAGATFLDVGCGSGLSSLAARKLGARVRSFDCDPECVACTLRLRALHRPDDPDWVVEQGDILDESYVASLGVYDCVHAWGTLHHTGDLARAMEHTARLVAPGGVLVVSIYNDQGLRSRFWRAFKRTYSAVPILRPPLLAAAFVRLWGFHFLRDLLRHGDPLHFWRRYGEGRGMDPWRDVVDWAGGYPFEVRTREEVVAFFRARGFDGGVLRSAGRGHGCNEFRFVRPEST